MHMLSYSLLLFTAFTGLSFLLALYARNVGPILGYTHENMANVAYSFGAMLAILIFSSQFVPPFEVMMLMLMGPGAILLVFSTIFRKRLPRHMRLAEILGNMFLACGMVFWATSEAINGQTYDSMLSMAIVITTALLIAMLALGKAPQVGTTA